MSLVKFTCPGFLWPGIAAVGPSGYITTTDITLDATGEKMAMIGRLYIDGRPTAAKTFSSAGGSIAFRAGTTTFANVGTNLDIGIQGVSTSAGPLAQPDGTFTVKKSCVPGTTAITTAAWNTIAMGTGSASLTHGDLIAVVWDMTARAGADSVLVTPGQANNSNANPTVNTNINGAGWLTSGAPGIPNVVIAFDDGTLATIDDAPPMTSFSTESFADATNPDERGLIFQVPFNCWVDQIWMWLKMTDASSDSVVTLYADPLGTPSSLASISLDSNQGGTVAQVRPHFLTLAAPVQLNANTNYCVALKAGGTSNSGLNVITVAAAAQLALWPGGSTMSKGTRNNSAGAFSATTTAIYLAGVRVSALIPYARSGMSVIEQGIAA